MAAGEQSPVPFSWARDPQLVTELRNPQHVHLVLVDSVVWATDAKDAASLRNGWTVAANRDEPADARFAFTIDAAVPGDMASPDRTGCGDLVARANHFPGLDVHQVRLTATRS